MSDDLHMEGLADDDVVAIVNQGLASLNARFEDTAEIIAMRPNLEPEEAEELSGAIKAACDAWDRFADVLSELSRITPGEA